MSFVNNFLKEASYKNSCKIGFISGENKYTYKLIYNKTKKVASYLQELGVKPGDRIGIYSTKSIEEIITIFAIFEIGAVMVNINPFFKADQVNHILNDCDLRGIFVCKSRYKTFLKSLDSGIKLPFICGYSIEKSDLKNFDSFQSIFEKEIKSEISEVVIDPLYDAAIIYTSGSTGMPKGIMVNHKVFYDSTIASIKVLKNNINDRIISMTPFSFDGALSQLFTSVMVNATLVLQLSNFPKDIVNTMLKEKISGFHGVPSFWRMMMQRHSPMEKYEYPSLRYISIIGESFSVDEIDHLKKIFKYTDLYIMYGTTEAFRSTYLPPNKLELKSNTVGIPFPGVTIEVINDEGIKCGINEVGEIKHKGDFIATGYLNNPKKSKEVFKNNSVYTGDLGYLDEEGFLVFVGRKDNMIKTKGFRVSPEEIENCIYQLKKVKECCVFGFISETGEKLIKVIVSCNEEGISEKDIIRHCRSKLPEYMIPRSIEIMESIPKTGTFKINRSAVSVN